MQNDNINITPDMLKNLSDMLKNTKVNNSNVSNNENTGSNYSSNSTNKQNETNKATFNDINFDNIVSNLGNMSSFDSSKKSSSNDMNIDFETILKIKTIVEKLNKKDDPRTNLLYSLKPYLNKNRQQKLDKYANILKISDVASLFKDQKKGDEN